MCNDPEFNMGGITTRWSYIHTGGLDLTNVLVFYTFEEGSHDSNSVTVMNINPTINSINVPRLTAGIRYTFNITAVNDIGSSYILCGPILLSIGEFREGMITLMFIHNLYIILILYIGIPLAPTIGELFAGSTPTEIKLQIKTFASGEAPGFRFNIISVRNGIRGTRQMFMNETYQSSTFVILTVGDLTEGGTYTFSATAENTYGESEAVNSHPIVIGGLSFAYIAIFFWPVLS